MKPALIEIKNLSFQYDPKHPILEDVSLSISEGDYVGIIGPNGSGKTTFLKLLLGLNPVEKGSIKLFGTAIEDFQEWEKIGYIPQIVFRGERNFPATVREVILSGYAFTRRANTMSEKTKSALLHDAIETAGVSHLLDRRIGEISGGELQRVFIARSLVASPKLLVLDEPTSGIDVAGEDLFYSLLKRLNEEKKITILLVSHDLEALAHNAKTALCLNRRVVYTGIAEGLHDKHVIESVFGARAWHPHE